MDKRFKNRVAGRYDRFKFETGVLDAKHKMPAVPRTLKSGKQGKRPKLGTLPPGPVRKKQARTQSTNKKIAIKNERRYGFMTKPWRKRTSKELRAFVKAFFELAGGKGNTNARRKKVTTAAVAVIQQPLLKGAYGRNTTITAAIKGFNRLMIDTGQMFKSIRAYVRVRKNVQK